MGLVTFSPPLPNVGDPESTDATVPLGADPAIRKAIEGLQTVINGNLDLTNFLSGVVPPVGTISAWAGIIYFISAENPVGTPVPVGTQVETWEHDHGGSTTGASTATTSQSFDPTGGATPATNAKNPPFQVVNYIIKADV